MPGEDKHGQKLRHQLTFTRNYCSSVYVCRDDSGSLYDNLKRILCVEFPSQPKTATELVSICDKYCVHTLDIITLKHTCRNRLNALFATKVMRKGRSLIFAVIIAPSTITRDASLRYMIIHVRLWSMIIAMFGNAHVHTVVQGFTHSRLHHISKSFRRMSKLRQGKYYIISKVRNSHKTIIFLSENCCKAVTTLL